MHLWTVDHGESSPTVTLVRHIPTSLGSINHCYALILRHHLAFDHAITGVSPLAARGSLFAMSMASTIESMESIG